MSDTLLERTSDGLHVEVKWLPLTETVVLHASRCGEVVGVTVAPERALDAFDHPNVYLNEAQVALLYPRAAAE